MKYLGILKLIKRLFYDIWLVIPRILVDQVSARRARLKLPSLYRNGYMILPSLDEIELEQLVVVFGELMALNQVDDDGQLTGRLFRHGLIDTRLAPIVKSFEEVASDYLNKNKPKLELTYFQTSKPQKRKNDIPGGEFHIDDTKANLKFFVYLSDVTEESGPFKAVPGTHRWNEPQRVIRAFWYAVTKSRASMYASAKKSAILEQKCTKFLGPAGTCFVVDATAWHAASTVLRGERNVFVASFNRDRAEGALS